MSTNTVALGPPIFFLRKTLRQPTLGSKASLVLEAISGQLPETAYVGDQGLNVPLENLTGNIPSAWNQVCECWQVSPVDVGNSTTCSEGQSLRECEASGSHAALRDQVMLGIVVDRDGLVGERC